MGGKTSTWYKRLAMLMVAGFICINAMAFMHAKAMVEFTDSHSRTESPEDLDLISKIKVLFSGVNLPRPGNKRTPQDIGLPFETHQYPGSNGHTLEAWYIPAANDDTLFVLFHGYADSKDTQLAAAEQLNDLGFSTLLVDFFGSGGSTGDRTTVGYLEAHDVSQSFNFVKQNWPDARVILHGYSMGGVALLRSIAVDNITPDGVVIEATFDRMLSTVQNRFSSMGIPATPLAQTLIFWGGWQSGFNAFKHNPVDYARAVTSPALVIHGHLDPRVTPVQAEAVYQQLTGWKHFSSYPSAGHKSVLKTDLPQWREDIKKLVAQVQGA